MSEGFSGADVMDVTFLEYKDAPDLPPDEDAEAVPPPGFADPE